MKKHWVFISGPGDVVGTYRHWKQGEPDPRILARTYSSQLYDVAQEHGAKLTLVHCHPDGEELDDGDFRFIHVGQSSRSGTMGYLLEQTYTALRHAACVRRLDPDLVMVASHEPFLIFRLLPRRCMAFVSLHNTLWPKGEAPDTELRGKLKLWFKRWALRPIQGALCVSQACKHQLQSLLGPEVDCRVPRAAMARGLAPRARPDRVRQIQFVGRMEENKGIFMLSEAFEDLADETPDLRLCYVGDGGALQALREAAGRSRHADRIEVTGRAMADEVHSKLQAADLLVCPTRKSFGEGLAMVTLEAAANGVPSVISTVVNAEEILGDACLMYPADDQAGLLACLRKAVHDEVYYAHMLDCVHAVSAVLQDPSEIWGVQFKSLVAAHAPA